MNEELLNKISALENEIKQLKAWQDEQRQFDEEAKAEKSDTLRMFNEWVAERKTREAKEQTDLEELRKMMM